MDQIQYYLASVADVWLITDLRIAFGNELNGPQTEEQTNITRQLLEEYFKDAIGKKAFICWLAKSGEDIVGTGGMVIREQPGNFKNPSGRWGYMMNMYTVPSHRKRGICAALVKKLMETGREMGISAFELHATRAGAPVYEQCGFEIHHEPTYRKYV